MGKVENWFVTRFGLCVMGIKLTLRIVIYWLQPFNRLYLFFKSSR